MTPQRHLVIFAKAPRLGTVKTRLAADVGDVAAWRHYRQVLAATLRRLGADPRWRCWLAVTPDADVRNARLWPRAVPRLPQGSGDLGTRMARTMRRLPPGPVVIVGSDIPDLRARHVARAFALLGRVDVVFGPAEDGGYWLVGARRRPRRPDLFSGVRWSSAAALADTRANLDRRQRCALLETLVDIDDGATLRRWRDRRRHFKPARDR